LNNPATGSALFDFFDQTAFFGVNDRFFQIAGASNQEPFAASRVRVVFIPRELSPGIRPLY